VTNAITTWPCQHILTAWATFKSEAQGSAMLAGFSPVDYLLQWWMPQQYCH